MNRSRRALLRTGAVGMVALSGCLSSFGGDGDDEPSSDDGQPGSENDTEQTDSAAADRYPEYDTIQTEGETVPLVPVDDAHEWYQDESARFVDARGPTQYQNGHVTGAVLSPAPDGSGSDDPVASWSKEQRIVCYCGCPHHLSSLRAASLLSDGYQDVLAIDEGYFEWRDRDYPVVGASGPMPDQYTISGETDPAEDAYAWAWHDPTGQREAAPIDGEGNYELHLRFEDVDEESTIRVKTPAYEIEEPLGDLVEGTVTGP